MLVCIHEDRPEALVGAKLLTLSLAAHCPGVDVVVSSPQAPAPLKSWLERQSNARLLDDPALSGLGWNTKATLLRRLLDEGHGEVVWIDSDIILAGDFRPALTECSSDTLVVTEENRWTWHPGGTSRTELWGLDVGRPLPTTINSGFVRVTQQHRELLDCWWSLLQHDGYLKAQDKEMYARPIHMVGDQDVLTALVGSRRFALMPVKFLRTGEDVITNTTPAGYTAAERLRNLGGNLPALVHTVDPKPWQYSSKYEQLSVELSPYTWVAARYLVDLDEEDRIEGLDLRSPLGGLIRLLTRDDPALRGLPQAVVHAAGKRVKRMLGRVPWPSVDSFAEPEMRPDGESFLSGMPAHIERRHPAVERRRREAARRPGEFRRAPSRSSHPRPEREPDPRTESAGR